MAEVNEAVLEALTRRLDDEDPAVRRAAAAVKACREQGIFAEGFSVEIARGAGAFVCGEETAMISALEGSRPEPRFRPPYPAQEGLQGAPPLVNNVETFASIPWIVNSGQRRFRALGTPGSPGTTPRARSARPRSATAPRTLAATRFPSMIMGREV